MSTYAELLEQGSADDSELVRVERQGDRAVVTLSEPERLNALSAVVRPAARALDELAADHAVRAIVLTGADPGFSAGGDLEMMEKAVDAHARRARAARPTSGAGSARVRRRRPADRAHRQGLRRGDQRAAAGVGLAFALTCDLAIASERALLVPAFGRLGLLPEVGTSWAMTRRLGYQGAFAFYAGAATSTRTRRSASASSRRSVAHDELLGAAGAWCERIAGCRRTRFAMTKPLLRATADASWESRWRWRSSPRGTASRPRPRRRSRPRSRPGPPEADRRGGPGRARRDPGPAPRRPPALMPGRRRTAGAGRGRQGSAAHAPSARAQCGETW